MIIETLAITSDASGTPNLAPLGPVFPDRCFELGAAPEHLTLRPYEGSTTLANLRQRPVAVLHFSTDADLFARTAIGKISPQELAQLTCPWEDGLMRLKNCERVFRVEVSEIRSDGPRFEASGTVTSHQCIDPPTGFCRGFAAVIEAAVMATRLQFLDAQFVDDEMRRLGIIVEKTAGDRSRSAFERLKRFVRQRQASDPSGSGKIQPIESGG
ncbi:MAG: DUF447 domain-containing protein [Planctomycetota bacterium]